jgi:hypothetical protein
MLIEALGFESLIVMPFVLLFAVLFKIIIVISLAGSCSLPVIGVADDTIDGSNPAATKTPVIASAMPAAFATQMPLDHIFSTKITPANRPIQSKFIHPRATMRRKYAQQQPRQYMP